MKNHLLFVFLIFYSAISFGSSATSLGTMSHYADMLQTAQHGTSERKVAIQQTLKTLDFWLGLIRDYRSIVNPVNEKAVDGTIKGLIATAGQRTVKNIFAKINDIRLEDQEVSAKYFLAFLYFNATSENDLQLAFHNIGVAEDNMPRLVQILEHRKHNSTPYIHALVQNYSRIGNGEYVDEAEEALNRIRWKMGTKKFERVLVDIISPPWVDDDNLPDQHLPTREQMGTIDYINDHDMMTSEMLKTILNSPAHFMLGFRGTRLRPRHMLVYFDQMVQHALRPKDFMDDESFDFERIIQFLAKARNSRITQAHYQTRALEAFDAYAEVPGYRDARAALVDKLAAQGETIIAKSFCDRLLTLIHIPVRSR